MRLVEGVARETKCRIGTTKVRTYAAKSLAKCNKVSMKRGLYAVNAEQKCENKAKKNIEDLKRDFSIASEACMGLRE